MNNSGVKCPQFKNISNIQQTILLTEYRFPEKASFQCNTGYIVKGNRQLSCLENGTWNNDQPTCDALKCRPPQLPTHASKTLRGSPYYYGDSIQFGCEHGYILNGTGTFKMHRQWRNTSTKNKDELRQKEPTLELDNSRTCIYSQVQEREATKPELPVLEIHSNNVYNNDEKEGIRSSGYYAFSAGSQLPNGAIEVGKFYKYVEMGRGKDGDIEQEFLVSVEHISINGYGQVRKYIAAQGPLDKTVDDFWSMVWQYDCGKIVMLTNVFENGKYWPDNEQQKTTFRSISLLLVIEEVYSDFTIRRLTLQSAGVGRTGTYIALDNIVNEAKERDYVEVFRSVEILRNQRVNMVQTAHQYLFLHEAVLEALMCPNSGVACSDFPDYYKDMMRFDTSKKKQKLQLEFEIMNGLSSRHDEEAFTKENLRKTEERTDIAISFQGYRDNKTFIVTQMPLETTVVDLWRLVYDYDIPTVVMLNQDTQKKSTNIYWPEGDESVTFGPFNITRMNTITKDLYTCLDLTYTYNNKESKQVTLFRTKFWEDNVIVPESANDMLAFLSATEDCYTHNREKGPVLVHCLNGCDKSGLYCVLATVIERLRIEQDVDIQHIIKQMRNRRPQIIPNFVSMTSQFECPSDIFRFSLSTDTISQFFFDLTESVFLVV
ncbi:PTPRK [Mytilus edulis]|uniref:PTPRK n=1 Tax=Mytilus edulis TaxID=6550 RepID=A0A8S3UCT7_MYTED|nr:PTPRK [Mytilus edulis]